MKMSELLDHVKDYSYSNVSGASLGCIADIVIKTFTEPMVYIPANGNSKCASPETIVQTHYEQIVEEEENWAHLGATTKYLRVSPELHKVLDDEGEFTGNYYIRSRIQFGIPGKCITMEQYENLCELGENRRGE